MSVNTIICPRCKTEIPIEEAVSHAFREKIEHQAKENFEIEKKLLREELEMKEKKLEESRQAELSLRKQKLELEEDKKSFEVDKQRQLDEERQKIRLKTEMEMLEASRLKDKEKDKVIEDLKNALTEAQRRASQGSQQLQGEIQELDLEETLRQKFPLDQIEPVGKGVRGADIRQIVKTQLGNVCGAILWESKRTKAWSGDWVMKLKDDLRKEKSNVAVIISTTLPEEAKTGIGLVNGVWVVNYSLYLVLADLLRGKLIDIAREKFVTSNRTGKAEALYQYITSHEFRQQIEAIVEVYQQMQGQVNRERAAFEKIWKAREAQVGRLLGSTANIIGTLQGSLGSALPAIKGMDLPGLEDGE